MGVCWSIIIRYGWGWFIQFEEANEGFFSTYMLPLNFKQRRLNFWWASYAF